MNDKSSTDITLNDFASKHLGQQGSYAITTDKYDASFLVPMPRALARADWGITGTEFVGVDVWHCHEATFLLDNGVPIAGTLKICYPADSEFMVESKSFKLYLNTFDMCKMGETISDAIFKYESQITKDLSACIGVDVQVTFHTIWDYEPVDPLEKMGEFLNLESEIGFKRLESLEITDFSAKERHIEPAIDGEFNTVRVYTNVLRSRCRHTKQKDTGTAYFLIRFDKSGIDLTGLFKEVVSLREVNEFHEFCAEKLYTSIMKTPGVVECMVMLLYSRRGSLDINPVRCTHPRLIPPALANTALYTQKTMGQ